MLSLGKVIRRRLFHLPAADPLSDGRLLERFLAQQDEAAFEELVRRHGPMVLRVCQRVLRHSQDAEDAFQATFIVLARKAETVAKHESVGSWLHGVAYRVALKARTNASQRHLREQNLVTAAAASPRTSSGDAEAHDLRAALDQELVRLPDKYRQPVVLCYLEGKTNEEAAGELQCPVGTVKIRLSRARDLLRDRLARQGLPCSGAALTGLLMQEAAQATVPAGLAATLSQASVLAASGKLVPESVLSAQVAALADAAMQGTGSPPMRIVLGIVLGLSIIMGGAYFLAPGDARRNAIGGQQFAPPSRLKDTLQGHEGRVYGLSYSADGRLLLSGDWKGTINVWDPATAKKRAFISPGKFNDHSLFALAIAPDSNKVVVSSWFGSVTVWDMVTGKATAIREAHIRNVVTLAYSPDGKTFATGGYDGLVKLWNPDTLQVVRTFRGYSGDWTAMAKARNLDFDSLPPEGKLSIQWQASRIASVAYSPDGRLLAAACWDGNVRVWNLATGQEVSQLNHGNPVYAVAFAPDSKTLAAGTANGLVWLWDATTGKGRATLAGHADTVHSVAFAPNGKTLASGGWDRVIKLWDLARAAEKATLQGHTDRVHTVAYAPDGKTLASASNDQTVKLWHVGDE